MKWQAKRNEKGGIVPSCWITDSGYLVAETRGTKMRFIVTRPGGTTPFAHLESRDEVIETIEKDQKEHASE